MTVNIFKDRLQHAKLFGKPVLTTSGIIRGTVLCSFMRANVFVLYRMSRPLS